VVLTPALAGTVHPSPEVSIREMCIKACAYTAPLDWLLALAVPPKLVSRLARPSPAGPDASDTYTGPLIKTLT
jgi:hypothetical protein